MAVSRGRGNGTLSWTYHPAGLKSGIYIDTITITPVGARGMRIVDTLLVGVAAPARTIARAPAGAQAVAAAAAPVPHHNSNLPVTVPDSNPMFFINASWLDRWHRMRAENHPIYQFARYACDRFGTPTALYGDTGWWCAALYYSDHNLAAGRKVIAKLKSWGTTPSDANNVREFFANNAVLTDWVLPLASPAERDTLIANLEGWARWALGKTGKPYLGGFRVADTDQSKGSYYGVILTDLLTAHIPGTPRWRDSAMTAIGYPEVPVGGVRCPSEINQTTACANVNFYAALQAGGEGVDGSEYQRNTQPIDLLGIGAINSALGIDAFPTSMAYFRDLARAMTFDVTPDLRQQIQWGDNEHGREFMSKLYETVTVAAMVAGITHDGVPQLLLNDLWKSYGATGYYGTASPIVNAGRLVTLYDPYLQAAAELPSGAWYARGRGHLIYKDAKSLVSIEAQPHSGEDHEPHYQHNVDIYREGEWALTHPLGYAGASNHPLTENGPSYAGLDLPTRTVMRVDSGSGWWAITAASGGTPRSSCWWGPTPAFVRSALRTTFTTSAISGWSVVVTRDSVEMSNPLNGDMQCFLAEDAATARETGGQFAAIWHAPVAPRRTETGWTWSTAHGLDVVIDVLGAGITGEVVNESTLWPPTHTGVGIDSTTIGQQLRIHTTGHVLISVVLVGRGTPPTVVAAGSGVRIGNQLITLTSRSTSMGAAP